MKAGIITINKDRNVTLTAYLQEVGGEFRYVTKRPAVLILPGGGFHYCSAREADPVAYPYLAAGYQVFILRYSVNDDAVWPNPLVDYEQAMELIRSRADRWSLYPDKIAVLGFSAGGHLAAAAATMAKNRPNAAILGYAVAGADVKGCNPSAPDTIPFVDEHTCPCFLFATRTDNVVPIRNSIRFMDALAEHDVAFESHIYAYGPHGFSTCDPSVEQPGTPICARVPNWVQDSIGWLGDMFGQFGPEGLAEPACKPHMSGDYEPYLSIDCTLGHLYENPRARRLIEMLTARMKKGMPEETREEMEHPDAMGLQMTLRTILDYLHVPAPMVEKLNAALAKMPNE